MAQQSQSNLLLFTLTPYINNELQTKLTASDFSIKYYNNDQNSKLAFHIFSNDIYTALNVYVYLQYTKNTSFSQLHFENIRKLSNGINIDFNVNNITQEFSLLNSAQIGLVLSMEIGNEFFNLEPGNILPLDYQIPNVLNYQNNYNILLLDDNQPLMVNGNAILLQEPI